MSLDIGQLLSGQVFAFLLIFTRVGVIMMLFPGIGEAFVNTRVRLLFSLVFTFVCLPLVADMLPPQPEQPAQFALLVMHEVLIGLFFGTILRLMMSALEIGGTFISMQMSLSNASIFNPTLATQGTFSGAFLSIAAVAFLFATGLESTLLRGVIGTYDVFMPGKEIVMDDIYATIIRVVNRSFALGAEMAAPFIIVGTLVSVAFGVVARLMPQIQIFTLSMPLHIGVGISLFGVTIGGVLLYWLQQFMDELRQLGW
ncbi:MAG: flagellar biosynthetic protein FliR [Alphaproteobacteria bacterium]|nr:flagellar biosynthetic protein FliR [Alphaproteobacteria bacterium]